MRKRYHLLLPFIGLQLVVMLFNPLGLRRQATHEGYKSHNPSLQADNPYLRMACKIIRACLHGGGGGGPQEGEVTRLGGVTRLSI